MYVDVAQWVGGAEQTSPFEIMLLKNIIRWERVDPCDYGQAWCVMQWCESLLTLSATSLHGTNNIPFTGFRNVAGILLSVTKLLAFL